MIESRRCMLPPSITPAAVKACFDENSKTWEFLDNLTDGQWRVTSFDPRNRLVCIEIDSCCNLQHHLMLTLPVISNSTRK